MEQNKFIEKAKLVHGDRYDYSKVNYINNKTKICIICEKHGEFWQTPVNHINYKQNCPKCSCNAKLTNEGFTIKAIQVHGDKYDYSKVNYLNNSIKVCIICPIHGEFFQKPNDHLNGYGCANCGGVANYTTKEYIKKAKLTHGDKYEYSKVEYVNAKTKVCIICSEHGEFYQMPSDHLNGRGCSVCGGGLKLTTEEFIMKSKSIHGVKYDYSKVEYKGNKTKICIICPIHGKFYQVPNSHMNGVGCPLCNESHLEKEIVQLLDEYNIIYERQKRFEWLGRQSLDFYLPDYKIGIECQGRQHYVPIIYFGGEKGLKKNIERDKKKYQLCIENNVKLLYFSNLGIEYPYEVIEDKNELLIKIK